MAFIVHAGEQYVLLENARKVYVSPDKTSVIKVGAKANGAALESAIAEVLPSAAVEVVLDNVNVAPDNVNVAPDNVNVAPDNGAPGAVAEKEGARGLKMAYVADLRPLDQCLPPAYRYALMLQLMAMVLGALPRFYPEWGESWGVGGEFGWHRLDGTVRLVLLNAHRCLKPCAQKKKMTLKTLLALAGRFIEYMNQNKLGLPDDGVYEMLADIRGRFRAMEPRAQLAALAALAEAVKGAGVSSSPSVSSSPPGISGEAAFAGLGVWDEWHELITNALHALAASD